MGRSPCCSKQGLNRGAWTALEDKILTSYIKAHGEGKWRSLPKRAGLKRCGKSCRLRWLNYLRPDIKRGNISGDEEELIVRLHKLLGNRWSLIAGRLPGRTDNEIKNYWNTTLGKKAKGEPTSTGSSKETSPPPTKSRAKRREIESKTTKPSASASASAAAAAGAATLPRVIRTKATRLTKVLVPTSPQIPNQTANASAATNPTEFQAHQTQLTDQQVNEGDCNNNLTNNYRCTDDDDDIDAKGEFCDAFQSLPLDEALINATWTGGKDCDLEDYGATLDLDSLAFLLDSEEWPSQENIA